MEPICGVPKILQKRINFPTFVGGGRGSRTTKKFLSVLFPTFVGGGGGKTGKELFPPYEVFFFLKASLSGNILFQVHVTYSGMPMDSLFPSNLFTFSNSM